MKSEEFSQLEFASSVRIIAYDDVEVRPGFIPGTYILIVGGQVPCANMQVALLPRIYINCPEYWGIEVTGSLPGGFCLPVVKPFVLTMDLGGLIGSKGIEVIGANQNRQFDLPGGCQKSYG